MAKVCYDYEIFAAQRTGGVSRYFTQLFLHMPSDIDTAIVAALYINKYLTRKTFVSGVRLPIVPRTAKIRKMLSEAWFQAYVRTHRCEVLHKTWYACHKLPRNTRVVITIHDMIPELYPDLFKSCRVGIRSASIDASHRKKHWCQRADAIIAVSETTKRDLTSLYGIAPTKIIVTPLASCIDLSLETSDLTRPTRPFLLYVGLRANYKNHSALFRAFSSSKRLKEAFDLVLFGGAPLSTEDKAELQTLGIANRVSWTRGSDLDLLRHYRNATALIYPSLYEGFGLPLVEAMSVGCPIVCSDTPALREIADDAAVYFQPRDVESIKSTIDQAVFDKQKLLDHAERGLLRSRSFSWARCAEQTAAVYRSLQ